ncbi:MAG TPA: polysaccharide deacetylase family protein, partial [Micromonosporaceae bacterium]|nr:polysaccharide deacetylase family protein [Micromonosporaceae bacterium]
MSGALSRRALLVSVAAAAGGATALTGSAAVHAFGPRRLPLSGGYAPAADPLDWAPHGQTRVIWHVDAAEPLVALTFDDGPGPQWTPMVLDTLERYDVPATFFVVGER